MATFALFASCLFNSPSTLLVIAHSLLAYGGLRTSIITDNIQGAIIILLLILCTIAIGTNIHIDPAIMHASGLVKPTQLSWQLLFIFFVAISFNLLIITVRVSCL